MNPVEIIIKKRDGGELTADEINYFIQGYADGDIPDYQAAAWAMAVYFQGMSVPETTALTLAMAESGEQLDLHVDLPPSTVIVDKHSSGGVGDKTTLAVCPIVAACGLPVGKMSGRGLSYTGGTIDKLESIKGWSPDLSDKQFRKQLREIGLVIAGQTGELAPADKVLYALRDVTGTVNSLPLIASSIMSKKLAAGADAIVLDVKCGRGAFMETLEDARMLSHLMVGIGKGAGRRVTALITQMNQPLGRAVGHALEVREAIAALRGRAPADFQELVEAIAGEMLFLAGELSREYATERVRAVIADGSALAKFREFVRAQGGSGDQVDDPSQLPNAPVVMDAFAPSDGWVQSIDAREVGLATVDMGGGRVKKGDEIDHRVGVLLGPKVGDAVKQGAAIAQIHAADEASGRAAVERVQAAYRIASTPADPLPVVLDRVTG